MKLSIHALEALDNFVHINEGIILHPGHPIMTRSEASEMYGVATVPDVFETKAVIGDLRQFLQLVKSYKDTPEVFFEEKRAVISPEVHTTYYPYGVEERIKTPSLARPPGISGDINVDLSGKAWEIVLKRGAIRKYPHAAFVLEDGELYFRCLNFKQPGQLFTEINLGTFPDEEPFVNAYTMENISRVHTMDYKLSISRKGPAQFKNDQYTYIALHVPGLGGVNE